MAQDHYKEVPNTIEQIAMDSKDSIIIDGIVAVEVLDSSGEILSVKGADISSLVGGNLNREHADPKEDGFGAVIGKCIYARKLQKPSDCADNRQLEFYNKLKLPAIYCQFRLFNATNHPEAQAAAAIIRDAVLHNEPLNIKYSVEGKTIEKDGSTLKSTIIRDVAATFRDCNKATVSAVLKDTAMGIDVQVRKIKKNQVLGGYENTFQPQDLAKALTAGSYNVAPSALTGGAALQRESLHGAVAKVSGPAEESSTEESKSESSGIEHLTDLSKMAIKDIVPGKPLVSPPSPFLSKKTEQFDYSHLLTPEQRANGFGLVLRHYPTHKIHDYTVLLNHGGQEIGSASSCIHHDWPGVLRVLDSHIPNKKYHGQRLGNAMYEAMFAHAYHQHGATSVSGEQHSSYAHGAHNRLSAKHGMDYEAERNFGDDPDYPDEQSWLDTPNHPFDAKYGPYRYAIKSEEGFVLEDLQKMAIRDIAPGPQIVAGSDDTKTERLPVGYTASQFDYSHLLTPEQRANGFQIHLTTFHHPRQPIHIKSKLIHNGAEIGNCEGGTSGGDRRNLRVWGAGISDWNYHGQRLGNAMYEAMYAHALHKHGITRVSGSTHSSYAHGAHNRLSAKHGMDYQAQPNIGGEDYPNMDEWANTPNSPFDDKFDSYDYAIKSEEDLVLEDLQKMAIKDLAVGQYHPDADKYDYTHLLHPDHVKAGYQLGVSEEPSRINGHYNIWSHLFHNGEEVGTHLGFIRPGELEVDTADVESPHIGRELRAKLGPEWGAGVGLGTHMLEAMYAHAYHDHGVRKISGNIHSTPASGSHDKISAKHGLGYKGELRPGMDTKQPGPYDSRFKPYKYVLKAEGANETPQGVLHTPEGQFKAQAPNDTVYQALLNPYKHQSRRTFQRLGSPEMAAHIVETVHKPWAKAVNNLLALQSMIKATGMPLGVTESIGTAQSSSPIHQRHLEALRGSSHQIAPGPDAVQTLFNVHPDSPDAQKHLLQVLQDPHNTQLLSDLEGHFVQNHPAIRHVLNKNPQLALTPNAAVLPAAWLDSALQPYYQTLNGIKTTQSNGSHTTQHQASIKDILDRHGLHTRAKDWIAKSDPEQDPVPVRALNALSELRAKHGHEVATRVYFEHIIPHLHAYDLNRATIQSPTALLHKVESAMVDLRQAFTGLTDLVKNESNAPKGPTTITAKHDTGGPEYHLLGSDPNYTYVKPVTGAVMKLKRSDAEGMFDMPTDPAPLLSTPEMGLPNYTEKPEQAQLLNGINLSQADSPPTHYKPGINDEGTKRTHPFWTHNAQGEPVYIKFANKDVGDDIANEAIYHNVAHSVFGLGQHVPTAAIFKHPVTGEEVAALHGKTDVAHIETIRNPSTYESQPILDHEDHLKALGDNGTLDKLFLMDHLLGMRDRHKNNFLLDTRGPNGIYLMDNSALWAPIHNVGRSPYYSRAYDKFDPKFKPQTKDWYNSLNKEALVKTLHKQGVDPAKIRGVLQRYLHAKEILNNHPNVSREELWTY